MKLEDIEVGQTVVDKFGNEYVVEIVSNDWMPVYNGYVVEIVRYDWRPVYLRCTKFVKYVAVQKHGVMFGRVDDCFWIYKSEKVAKKDGIENCITVESLKLKE